MVTTWSPPNAYASACDASAAHVTSVADDFRAVVADWMKRADERFEGAKVALAKTVDGAHCDWATKQEVSGAPVLAVQKSLETEFARA